ncbi:MAG: S24 family peptidase, partial [Pseudomonadota bacterium]|nr:S24 family peptidase [Pseudomonadota bacterium]
ILHRMQILGLSQADLMRATEASKGTVSKWLAGTNLPSGKFISDLAKALKTTPEWLLKGGDLPQSKLSATELAQVAFDMVASPDAQMIEIPIYSVKASCGNGHENPHEEIMDYMRFDPAWLKIQGITTSPANLRIIFATEMSMWPSIEPESILIVDTSDADPSALRTGKIYVFQYAYELRVKRVFVSVDGHSIKLCSDNPDKSKFPDEIITPEQAHSINFVGRVVWRGGEM